MSSLAELPELVGFFSYSREDDEVFNQTLPNLRGGIDRELGAQLGRSKSTFRLWQDKETLAPGKLWESEIKKAIDQSSFFIPIVTPRWISSKYCNYELECFLAREKAIGRSNLVFPMLYISVAALENEAKWRDDPILSAIGRRQYFDWRPLRHLGRETTEVRQQIERFCLSIVDALIQPWSTSEEREQIEEAKARQQAEREERRQDAEVKRIAEEEQRRRQAEEEARRLKAEGKRRAEEVERRKQPEVGEGWRASDIFISYASEDRDRAEMLAKTLEGRGWSIFWDRTIPIGKTWRETIGRELNHARCVIVLWSKNSIESGWVQEEADHAKRRGVLFPALIEDVQPPFGFGNIQSAHLENWDGREPTQGFRRLIADITGLIGNDAANIFLSYVSVDHERVRVIHDALMAEGFNVFWDKEVEAGIDWDTWIRNHLTQAKCVLALWSKESISSDNVRHEATVAKRQNKLIHVLLDPLTAEQFPMGLYTVRAANLAEWKGDFEHVEWKKLRHEIGKVILRARTI